jgi:feruloyl esterase
VSRRHRRRPEPVHQARRQAVDVSGLGRAWYPTRNIVSDYGDVQKHTKNAGDSVRLFMVPGMGHCGGGNGTSTFDMAAALDQWVVTGKAPQSIPASRMRSGAVDRTRPLCAYPQCAAYKGTGSVDDAVNFECRK